MFIKKIKSLGVKRGLTYFTLSSFAGFSLFGIGYTIQQIKKRDADAARTIVLTDDRSFNPTNPSSVHNNIGPLFTVLFKEWILSFLDENRDDQQDFLRKVMAGYSPANKKARPFFGNIKQIEKDLERERSKPIPSDKKQQNQLKDNIKKLEERLKGTLSLQEYLANEIFSDTSKLTSDQKTELKKLAKKVKDHELKFKFSENYGSIFKLNDGLQQGTEGQKILPNLMFLYSDNFYNFYNNLWRNKFPSGLPGSQNIDSSPELKINKYGYINNKDSIVKGIYQNSADPNNPNEDKNAKLLMVPFGKSFSNFMFVNKGLLAEMLYILGKKDLMFDNKDDKKGFEIEGVKSWNDFQNLSLLKIKDKTNKYPYTPSLAPLYSNQKSGIFTPLSRLTKDAFKKLGLEQYENLQKESLAEIFDDPNKYAKFSTIIYKLVWWQYEYNKAFFEEYIDKKTTIKNGKKQDVYSYKKQGHKDLQDPTIKEKVLKELPNIKQDDYFKTYFNDLLKGKTSENYYALGNDDITGSFYLQFAGGKNGEFLYKENLNQKDHKYNKGRFTFNIENNKSKIKSYLEFVNQFKKSPKINTTEQDWHTHFGGLYMRNFQRSGQAYGSDWFTRGKMLASLGSTAGLYQLLKGNKANPKLLWAKPDMVFSGEERSLMSGPNLAVLEHKEGLLNNIWNTLNPIKNKVSLYFALFATMPNINRIINANMSYFPIHKQNWNNTDIIRTFQKFQGSVAKNYLEPQQEIYTGIVATYGKGIDNLIVEHKVSSLGQELRGIFNFVFNDYYVDKMYIGDRKKELGDNQANYKNFIDSLKNRVELIKKNAIVDIEYND